MINYLVYPQIFQWDQIIPVDYPFIKMHGPDGCVGVLMVFTSVEEYRKFCGETWHEPIRIQQEETKDGKEQNGSGQKKG